MSFFKWFTAVAKKYAVLHQVIFIILKIIAIYIVWPPLIRKNIKWLWSINVWHKWMAVISNDSLQGTSAKKRRTSKDKLPVDCVYYWNSWCFILLHIFQTEYDTEWNDAETFGKVKMVTSSSRLYIGQNIVWANYIAIVTPKNMVET